MQSQTLSDSYQWASTLQTTNTAPEVGCMQPHVPTFPGCCPQAEHPPYDLGPEIAARAEELFQDMLARGIQPNQVVFHTLMDVQASSLRWCRQVDLGGP